MQLGVAAAAICCRYALERLLNVLTATAPGRLVAIVASNFYAHGVLLRIDTSMLCHLPHSCEHLDKATITHRMFFIVSP